MLKYLKTYEGVTSGSPFGRDDGYAEMKLSTFSNIEGLEKFYGKHKGEQYYILVPMTDGQLAEELKGVRQKEAEKAKIKQRESILKQIEQLEHELGKLY
jgi:hypothetical protein